MFVGGEGLIYTDPSASSENSPKLRRLGYEVVHLERQGQTPHRWPVFNVFNHPNFGLPVLGNAGVPGKPSTQTGFGALTYTTSPPTGLLGVGLGGDSSPRMIAFQARLEF
jgi:hypothetical protein